jgi:hypothetical protein
MAQNQKNKNPPGISRGNMQDAPVIPLEQGTDV